MKEPTRKLAAIVFTDIVGFTELMGRNENRAMALLEQQRSLLRPIVDNFNGEWLKEIGETVAKGDPLVEVETEKAVLEMEALDSGVLVETISGVGTEVPVGAVIGYLEAQEQ